MYKMKMQTRPINLISQLRPLSQWDGQKTKESRKERRPRTVFTGSQLLALESVYQSQRLLCRCERARLAGALALTPAQVKVWFQNRRTKSRRDISSQTSVKGNG
ncbi:homeobox protein H40-like [Bolinopsis microptera]|uniref:homeobox protein H40-like n=1 Tax=Bolinopsis microptera TaxID=2820187 RepID=UPI00307A5ED6